MSQKTRAPVALEQFSLSGTVWWYTRCSIALYLTIFIVCSQCQSVAFLCSININDGHALNYCYYAQISSATMRLMRLRCSCHYLKTFELIQTS